MATILDRILATKRQEVACAKASVSEAEMGRRAADAPPPRDLAAALRTPGAIRLIAEVKKASPSRGVIRPDFDPVAIARVYEAHGAAALSVLTDEAYFQGRLEHLRQVRAVAGIPVLRKDFVIDPYQVFEARAAGADAVLLIAECLDPTALTELHALVRQLGMAPLVEIHRAENLARVVEMGAELIGINNRDLRTFEVDLEHTLGLRAQVPADRILVSESGIRSRADALRLEAAGVHAMLVGESLMRQADIGLAVDRLLGKATGG